jgi:dimethylamine monooxygenase subunit A
MRLTEALPRPFAIGIKPLDFSEWIDADGHLGSYLAEKARLWESHRNEVFAAEADTLPPQSELLALLAEYLPSRFPDHYQRDGDTIRVAGRRIALDGPEPPLAIAASLVQEDLVLMRRGAEHWRLGAASLCFPSAWLLAEKFGKPMHQVHAPVPGFAEGTRNAAMIERMFDNLRTEAGMIRWNWSIFGDDRLFHPDSHATGPRFGEGASSAFFRLERQTFRKLPVSGAIVFSVRIYIDPLDAIARLPEGPGLAATLSEQLAALTPEQADYKGLLAERDVLLARLEELMVR